MNITPSSDFISSYKQGSLINTSVAHITAVLGFGPNQQGDGDKVNNCWVFHIDGKPFSIWDWKGSERRGQFSYFGDAEILGRLFLGKLG